MSDHPAQKTDALPRYSLIFPIPLLLSYVALKKLSNLSNFQFPHL